MTLTPTKDYLNQDNKMLGNVLVRLKQLNQWNTWLAECLPEEKELTEHCHIVNLVNHSLILLADNPHWATRIRFRVPGLLPKMRKYPGLEKIQAICSKVQPLYVPYPSKKNLNKPIVLSEKTAKLLRESAMQITDEKLRIQLEKMATYTKK